MPQKHTYVCTYVRYHGCILSTMVHLSVTSSVIGMLAYRSQIYYLEDIEAPPMLMVCINNMWPYRQLHTVRMQVQEERAQETVRTHLPVLEGTHIWALLHLQQCTMNRAQYTVHVRTHASNMHRTTPITEAQHILYIYYSMLNEDTMSTVHSANTCPCVPDLPFASLPARLATSLQLLLVKKGVHQTPDHPTHAAPPAAATGRQHPIHKHLWCITTASQHCRPLSTLYTQRTCIYC